jgi:hypothetical protein
MGETLHDRASLNHLVISYPNDERLMQQAARYFGTSPTLHREIPSGASFAFFGAPRSFFRNPVDGVCICGNVLNPEDLDAIFSQSTFEKMDGVCVAARINGEEIDLVSDRLGFHPLYRYEAAGKTVFSTHLDFMALHLGRLQVDSTAWSHLLTYSFCLNNSSPFQEIRRVPHGTHIRIGKHGVASRCYEDYLSEVPHLNDLNEAVDRCHEAFEWSMDRFRSFSPHIAVPLSGGTDSRLCAALVSQHQQVACFSTSKDVGLFGNHSEINLAERVASSLKADFHTIQMPENYFQRHFESTLLRTDFQTTCHTWYGELIEQIPPQFVSIVEGLGDTGFKYDYISGRMLWLTQRGQWNTLCQSIDQLYRQLLVDRLSHGEELLFFQPEQQEAIRHAKQQAFRDQFNSMPRNANLPINLLMHTRFRRLIAPSVQQLLGAQFNLFSPYLSRRVNTLLWSCTPNIKRDLRLMNAYFEQKFPQLHPQRLPSTTATGIGRIMEMAVFDGIGILPNVVGEMAYRLKSSVIRNSIQYSEATLTFLHEIINQGDRQENGGDFEAVRQQADKLSTAAQIDIAIRIATFALWHRRYFCDSTSTKKSNPTPSSNLN